MKDLDAQAHALILRLVARAIREQNPKLLEETADDLDRAFGGASK